MADLQYKPSGGDFFSFFLQGTYIKASKHKAKDKRRHTSWSEVERANGPDRAIQSVSSLSCIQAAASVNLSCGCLGYSSIVPHGSNPFSSFLFFNCYYDVYHHRTQASTISILFAGRRGRGRGRCKQKHNRKNNNVKGQRASVLDLALSPTFPQIKGNHNT